MQIQLSDPAYNPRDSQLIFTKSFKLIIRNSQIFDAYNYNGTQP